MNKINTYILQKYQANRYILGLSGGADSIVLLNLLLEAKIEFKAIYVNHGLREIADSDERFLKHFCAEKSIAFLSTKIDIKEYQLKNKASEEEAGRNLRYAFMFDIAESEGYDGVLVAHHFDDQAESILMHLLRGSGMDGLSGMQEFSCPSPFHTTIPLIRPLLSISKKEILSYCKENGIVFLEDESNLNLKYRRNLIRNEIFPLLEKYNPKVKAKFVQLGIIADGENDFIEAYLEEIEDKILKFYNYEDRFVEIERSPFLNAHPAIQKRLLRKAIKALKPSSKNIGFKTISKIQEEIGKGFKTNRLYFEDHLLLIFNHDVCYLCEKADAFAQKEYPQIDNELKLELKNQIIQFNAYDELVIEEIDQKSFQNRATDDLMSAYIDGDSIDSIIVSNKKAGDRIRPLGFGGQSKKISVLLIDKKVHREARANYPIFRNQEGVIIWVPGFKISIDYPVLDTSKRIFKLRLCKQKINKNNV